MDSGTVGPQAQEAKGTDKVDVVTSDEEEEILELEEVREEIKGHNQLCLLARVLGTKHVNPQAFSNLMDKVWNPMKGIEAEQIGGNLFLFRFFSKRDRQDVMEAETPWFFKKRLVVLKEITGDEVLSQVQLMEVPIWIQKSNIPLNQHTRNNVIYIASKV
ncbi:hypothetical protein Tsubulata_028523 [Turnera subulata]|uniref:DUF4283 domain-containing protein n=1 Tax=Turnera subulata TaxID=218843 RepID=A0A9Q0JII2_9ROSI|nr:hypothetical protein Tsubulata_028523 [Turnera subulata]